ncbi:hypothetical protein LguiB_011949 [Lonicera macranthoides]
MSSSSEIVDSGRISGSKMPERSNFSQTCSLLSQYIKENGTLGDLTFGINNGMPETYRQNAPATTMNFFPVVEKQSSISRTPSLVNFGSPVEVAKKLKNETSQMTIFYGGQVIVLNDMSVDKAKEVMLFASNSTSRAPKTFSYSANLIHKPTAEFAQRPTQPIVADLPIARKASLTRFLEKRKDRIVARAPYQISAASKPEESKAWLGLAALSPLQS